MRMRRVAPARGIVRCWCAVACAVVAAGCLGAAHTPEPPEGSLPVARSEARREPKPSPAADGTLPVPFDLREGVERANILGTNLFLLDVATARARDALSERFGAGENQGGAHYLALMGDDDEGRPNGTIEVLFFSAEEVPRLAHRVVIGGGRRSPEVRSENPPGIVHDPLMTLLNARALALEAVPRTNQVVNTVLMPQHGGRIIVYVLAASNQPNVAVLGRHYRVEVAEDGVEVERVMMLSKAELELPTRDPSGQQLAALAITEGDVEHPTETHVFSSRLANVPLIITTGRGRWKVRATGIDYLGPP